MFYCTKNGSERTPSSFIFRRMVRNKITKFWAFFSFTKLFGNGIPSTGEFTTLAYAWSRLCTNFSSFYTTLVVREYSLSICLTELRILSLALFSVHAAYFFKPILYICFIMFKGTVSRDSRLLFFSWIIPRSLWVFFCHHRRKIYHWCQQQGLGNLIHEKNKSKISTLCL